MWKKPEPDECADYYHGYIRQVPDGDDLPEAALREMETLRSLLAGVSEEESSRGYAPGNGPSARSWATWPTSSASCPCGRSASPGVTTRRYRVWNRIPTWPPPATGNAPSDPCSTNLETIRHATVSLMRSFDRAALERRGKASGAGATVRAICYLTVGHAIHHRRVLEERYL